MAKEINRKFLVKTALWRAMAAERSIGRVICRRSRSASCACASPGTVVFLAIKGLTTGGDGLSASTRFRFPTRR
jgi:CYTH domain-containing protein